MALPALASAAESGGVDIFASPPPTDFEVGELLGVLSRLMPLRPSM